ncbi:hypothetical protein BDV59DRAFT_187731 [Aspergillus ambiguus]|uniref:uncharacterized protein n=1 Tax=Aspergillus ambiguus TaxID=176160 RepID=UPI003CCCDA8A
MVPGPFHSPTKQQGERSGILFGCARHTTSNLLASLTAMSKHYLPPPPGVHPNYTHPAIQYWNIAIYILFLVLVTVAVLLRLYTRLRISRFPCGADDFFCTLSYLLSVAYTGIQFKVLSVGIGHHIWEVPTSSLAQAAALLGVANFMQLALLAAIKLTFLSFYYHYFWLHAPCRRMIIVGTVIICAATLISFGTTAATAVPSLSPAHNMIHNKGAWSVIPYVNRTVDMVTNIYILMVPIPCLRRLQLGSRDKIKVAGLYMLGLCGCAAGITQLALTPRIWTRMDLTWTIGILAALTVAEANIGIICACLLLLPYFLDGNGPGRIAHALSSCFRYRDIKDDQSGCPETSQDS